MIENEHACQIHWCEGGDISSAEMPTVVEKIDDQNALDSASSLLESAYEPSVSRQASLARHNSAVSSSEMPVGVEKLDDQNALDSASSLLESSYEPTASYQPILEHPYKSDHVIFHHANIISLKDAVKHSLCILPFLIKTLPEPNK